METIVTIENNDVLIQELNRTTILVGAAFEYRKWCIRAYRAWDGNDMMDLLNFMGEPENAERFAQYWPIDRTVEIINNLN